MAHETFISIINREVLHTRRTGSEFKIYFSLWDQKCECSGENQHSLTARDVNKLKISIFSVI